MRAIVTGGAGFIGSHVVEALLARGDEVHVLDDLSKGRRENVPAGATLHEADIRAPDAVFEAVAPEVVVHLAAQADVRVSVERPGHDADVNVIGTIRILEAARRHGAQIVFASTGGAIYGECDGPAPEDGGPAAARAVRHVEARRRGVPRDLEPPLRHAPRRASLRATSTGRGRSRTARPASSRSSWGSCAAAGRRRSTATAARRATTSSSATSRRALVARRSAARAVSTTSAPASRPRSSSCTRRIQRAAGVEREPTFAEARLGELQRQRARPALAGRDLGWRPERSLEEGLAETWSWMQEA